MHNHSELMYQIALTQIKGIGDVLAKNLIAYCGSASSVFREKKSHFLKIPGIAEKTAEALYQSIHSKEAIKRAEQELYFIESKKIRTVFYTDAHYPRRLKHCHDGPIMLYIAGNVELNPEKTVAIVGTRTPSNYGKEITKKLVEELSEEGVQIISGMAYGIDITAHRACLEHNIPTIGVMAHGLDTIYPSQHRSTAAKMLSNGAILTEFISNTNPDRENFPKRNRIVAGMSDAVIIIETRMKGGSLITAEIANSYSRDVFAFPGRAGDEFSEGCNAFIKRNKASLLESAADLIYAMGWQKKDKVPKLKQMELPVDLSPQETIVAEALKNKGLCHIDELTYLTGFTVSELSGILLQLEFSGIVNSKPGKQYEISK